MSEQDATQATSTAAPKQKIKKKQLFFLVGAVVVAVMFLTSYAAFGNNGAATTTTTTIAATTIPVFGNANAIVSGYASSMTLIVKQSNASSTINQTLSDLESNGSINDYIQTQGAFIIYSANANPYQLQQIFLSKLPANSIAINGTEKVTLPRIITLYYRGQVGPQPLSVYTNMTNFTISTAGLQPLGANLNVTVEALVLENGLVYQNNIEVSEA